MNTPTPTPTPIHKTPKFWRERAEEWRGPWTVSTQSGICYQLNCTIDDQYELDEAEDLLYTFAPQNRGMFFFPLDDRDSRAELCDHIANTLEKEQQNETFGIQTSTQAE